MERSETVKSISEMEAAIADKFSREHCVLTGRATTGLYLLFEALDVDGEVIYPAYTCPSPVYAAVYADATPVFCDVRRDYTIDPDELNRRIGSNTAVVVAIDLFGHPVLYDRVETICESTDTFLVEDACQAVGTTYGGRNTGVFGDAALLSFGEKKPLDAGGGGAVLTDDPSLAGRLRELADSIPVRNREYQSHLYAYYRDLYYLIDDLREITDRAEQLFATLPEVFRELYVTGLSSDRQAAIRTVLDEYESVVETRRHHADLYQKELNHPDVTHPETAGDPVFYRYSVQFPDEEVRNHVVSVLRERDFHASTLYDPIHRRFGADDEYPTAVELTERTLNLWVSPAVDSAYVRDCVEVIKSALRGDIDG